MAKLNELSGMRCVYTDYGYFDVRNSSELDCSYPGVDIEFIANEDVGQNCSRPRIVFELHDGKLHAHIWNDPEQEDYTDTTEFSIPLVNVSADRCQDCVCLCEKDDRWFCDEADAYCADVKNCPEGL